MFAGLQFINSNEDLEVLSQIYPMPYDRNDINLFFCQEIIFSKRIYNISSGKLLLYEHPDYNDFLALRSSFTILFNGLDNEFYQEGDKIRYQDVRFGNNFEISYYTSLIDFSTNKSNFTEFSLSAKSCHTVIGSRFKINENKSLLVESIDSFHILI